MAKRIISLPETKGKFQVKGITFGTKKDGFFKEIKTKAGDPMNFINFGIKYDADKTVYVGMNGMVRPEVYYSKKAEKKGEKSETKKVAWSDRYKFNENGFKLIGKTIGVVKTIDENGKEVNDTKHLTDFDAVDEIHNKLADEKSVFIRGDIEYGSYTTDNGEVRRTVKLVPAQVSLCQDVSFSDEYEPVNNFNQVIVFTDISKEKMNDKDTGRFIVNSYIVNYSNIEKAEFYIENAKLAQVFKTKLKPYTAIMINGKIVASTATETVDDDDHWGEEDEMNKVTAPTKREFIITGATPSSRDTETYSKDKIEEALAQLAQDKKAEESFGSKVSDDWGDTDGDDDVNWDN